MGPKGGRRVPRARRGPAISLNMAVNQKLAEIGHPMPGVVQELRELILAVDPAVKEGIKWNSMSFRTTEWFATFNQRALDRVEFVFHLGAKVKGAEIRAAIPDIPGCIEWKSGDRCLVTFRTPEEARAHHAEFKSFVEEWIKHV